MSRTWKWILGVVLILVLLVVAGGISFVAMRGYGVAAIRALQSAPAAADNDTNPGTWRMPMHDIDGGPMMPYHQRGFGQGYYPHMGVRSGYGMLPFGMGFFWLGGLFRLVVPLGLVALIVFLGYQWGKRAGTRSAQAAPIAAPTPPAPPAPPASPSEASQNEGGEPQA